MMNRCIGISCLLDSIVLSLVIDHAEIWD